ncbi:hypothetical protein GXM_06364 [Nostoc sphaeroides CCNUC1]|uniref:Uncharacterized protein n=1 Tax=Nostoc sphaeroides CCNUC1 TaxID=2653204 RepID=A0A5P8W885_9NOSO|nr:hypothetical protein GXM_06364 [Nostoc sphaeroides CCNUC1]
MGKNQLNSCGLSFVSCPWLFTNDLVQTRLIAIVQTRLIASLTND